METGNQPADTIYQIRKRLSSISISKAFIFSVLCLVPFIIIFLISGAADRLTGLRFEALIGIIIYTVPLLLIAYAFKKKNLRFFPILKNNGKHLQELWMAVPLILFSFSIMWVTILFLNLFDAELAQAYLDFMNSIDFLQTSPDTPLADYLLIFTAVAVLPPLFEEIVFRGAFVERLGHKYSMKTAVITSSVIFGMLHVDIFGALMAGFILCLIYLKTLSLFIPVVIHAINNGLVVIFIFIDDKFLQLEPWDHVDSYLATGWIGLVLFAISGVWLAMYLKENWNLVHQIEPVPKNSPDADATDEGTA